MARDESPTGSSETKGSGGSRVVGSSPGAMKGDNGGDLMSKTRSWDEGQPKGFQGCDLAEYKGSATSQKSDATMQNPSGKGMPATISSMGPKEFPAPRAPLTGGPRGMGVDGGHGPKVKGSSTGGDVQKGGTGGTDKSPKGSGSTPSGVKGGGFVGGGGYGPMSKSVKK